ncbi:MAG: inhibitor of KinA [Glaciecola sp.]|jgi:KipI family sensor histidine kinase inhibitor
MTIINKQEIIEIRTASDCCVIVYVDDTVIGLETANKIIEILTRALLVNRPPWLCEYIPSYTSLLIEFSLDDTDHIAVNTFVKELVINADKEISKCIGENVADTGEANCEHVSNLNHKLKSMPSTSRRIHRIPVCYELTSLTTDLSKVAKDKNISENVLINLHCANSYRVFATGFMPGFAYLGELPMELCQPRLSKPRLKVPKGAVAIADRQTAIYPDESPGGWHIIGYTPLELLFSTTDVNTTKSRGLESLLKTGDSVEFYPITESEYINWVHS